MKLPEAKLPPGYWFDREEANERSELGQQSAQASAEASADPSSGLALALSIHQRFKGMGIDKFAFPSGQRRVPQPIFSKTDNTRVGP